MDKPAVMSNAAVSRLSIAERLWRAVSPEPNSGCWLWTGTVNSWGYPLLSIGNKVRSGHRLSYETFRGPIPEGMCVCHTCDIPSCINPDHLWIGTNADNSSDKQKKGRAKAGAGDKHWTRANPEKRLFGDKNPARKYPGLHAGEKNSRARLTADQVKVIRLSDKSGSELAREYGVAATTISAVRLGKSWAK
jgi:hypothetical protein